MARTFNEAIASHGTEEGSRWRVLQPATGTGKTQGARLFSALTALRNETEEEKVGILIVTRERAEADNLANEINESVEWLRASVIGGSASSSTIEVQPPINPPGPKALARHSQAKGVKVSDMAEADVLIITHEAYVRALDALRHDNGERWSDFIEWKHGTRRLTIVDETITNIVETYQLDVDNLRRVEGLIPVSVWERYPRQREYLRTMITTLERIRETVKSKNLTEDRVVWNKASSSAWDLFTMSEGGYDMSQLRVEVEALPWDLMVSKQANGIERDRWSRLVSNTLRDVQAIFSRWAWYAKKGDIHTLNSSRLLIPDTFPGPVVLDATASQEVLWELLGDRVVRPVVPPHVRNYANVTIRLARARGLGKQRMKEEGKKRLARVFADLNDRLNGQDRRVLMVLHKDVEHLAVDCETTFGSVEVAHWGAIDGKNQWKDCDTAVIVGLPYRDRIWANNLFMSVRGVQDNRWLMSNHELRQDMETRQKTVSLVQAINRVRCRKVVDGEGNCPPAEVFLLLPENGEGDRMLEALKQEMPGAVVEEWNFSLDGEGVALRRGSSHEGLIRMMENRGPGEVSMTHVQREFNLSAEGLKTLKTTLRKADHPLTKALAEINVAFVSTGYGKGSKSFLIKTDPAAVEAA
jgi:hypothetical protein